MNALKISRVFAGLVIAVGIFVMLGWFFDVAMLKSVLPGWVSMKFTTALSFVFSGIILYASSLFDSDNKTTSSVAIIMSSLIILMLMLTLFISSLMGLKTGLEDLFVKDVPGAVKTVIPGRPSIFTMVNFILVAFSGFMVLLELKNTNKLFSWIGWVVSAIGGIAIIGYLIGVSVLTFNIEGFSTAMALHTALLFVLLGGGFIFLSQEGNKELVNI